MKTCDKCVYAEWDRTKNGRLCRNKLGKCTYVYPKLPPLPNVLFWVSAEAPEPYSLVWIKRGRKYDTHCPYWSAAK